MAERSGIREFLRSFISTEPDVEEIYDETGIEEVIKEADGMSEEEKQELIESIRAERKVDEEGRVVVNNRNIKKEPSRNFRDEMKLEKPKEREEKERAAGGRDRGYRV